MDCNFSDEQLIEKFKAGEALAFEVIYDKYKNMIKSCARKFFLVGGDNEDLMQEGVVGLLNAVNTFNGKSGFSTYAYTCIKNSMITAVTRAQSQKNQPLNNYISLSGWSDNDSDKTEIIIDSEFGPEERYINKETEKELINTIKNTLS